MLVNGNFPSNLEAPWLCPSKRRMPEIYSMYTFYVYCLPSFFLITLHSAYHHNPKLNLASIGFGLILVQTFYFEIVKGLRHKLQQGVRWQEIIEGATFCNNDVMMTSQ